MKALEIVILPHTSEDMGRPPLGMKQTTIRLPAETIRRIEAVQGKPRQLASFIREAIENELRRREEGGN